MKLVTTHFTTPEPAIAGRTDIFHELFEVFKQSVKENMPNAEIVELHVDSKKVANKQRIIYTNHQKLIAWAEYAKTMNENAIFIDCDMLILGDLSEVFDLYDFDVAITARESTERIPFNGGVVFVRNTEKAKAFMQRWSEVDMQMFKDPIFHRKYKIKYQGMNQSALGYLYEEEKNIANLTQVPCSKYNALNRHWTINENTPKEKMPFAIHFKGSLRRQLFSPNSARLNKYPIKLWKEYRERVKND